MATNKKQTDSAGTMKLEEAMRRLDAVVKELDREQLDLEQALKLYEEGVGLVRICNDRLKEAEMTVKILKMKPDGEITEEAFDAE